MASLAIIVAIIFWSIILGGPFTYLLAKLNAPNFIVYVLSILCILSGIWFCTIAIPVWYVGLIPIYFGYISIVRANKKETQG